MTEDTTKLAPADTAKDTADATPVDTQVTEQPQEADKAQAGAVATSGAEPAEWDDDVYREAIKALPPEAKKHLDGVLTKKFQGAAEARKKIEGYAELIEGLETDPDGTLKLLTQTLGKQPDIPGAPAESQVKLKLRTALGPELAFLADKLAPAIEDLVNPLQQSVQDTSQKAALLQAEQVLKTFGVTHPDWQQHEAEMTKLAKTIQPNGMEESEFLELLYTQAKIKKGVYAGEAAKTVVDQINRAASNSEAPTSATPQRVTPTIDPSLSFEKQFDAAWDLGKRDIRIGK